jgi:hypothetical protein
MAAGEARVRNELCDRRNDQVLDAVRSKQGNGANEVGLVGHRTKKLLEMRATPFSVPARKSCPLYRKAARHLRTALPTRFDTLSQDNEPTSHQNAQVS